MLAHFQNEMTQPLFWLALGKVVWIDILLSGDNALGDRHGVSRTSTAPALLGNDPRCRRGCDHAHRVHWHRRDPDGIPYLKIAGGVALLLVATKCFSCLQDGDADVKKASDGSGPQLAS
jgi:hypothetical protein